MTHLTTRLATLLATCVLGTTLLASGANAAVLATGAATIAAVRADPAQTVTAERGRPERDGDHHRRFCVKLNAVLSRLVENDVITREQKVRILEAFNCLPDRPATTDRTSARPTAAR